MLRLLRKFFTFAVSKIMIQNNLVYGEGVQKFTLERDDRLILKHLDNRGLI